MVTQEDLVAQIRALEVQVKALKAELRRHDPSTSQGRFADLHGILAGQVETTEEDLDAVRYRIKWDADGEAPAK